MKWLYVLPALLFLALAGVLFYAMNRTAATGEAPLPSMLVGKKVPNDVLPPLDAGAQGFAPKDLSAGQVTVVNVFASWCAPCHSEAPMLMRLASRHDLRLVGMVQKDTPANIRNFLAENGNPFSRIGLDADGRASIDWGVYGVPETFVVDGHGIVRARIVGEITEDVLAHQLLPAIAAARTG